MDFTGRTAVVTGGSRGIGRAIVRRLARDGVRVVFSYAQDRAAADELVRELGTVVAVRADQEDLSRIDELFAPVGERLDILVNNAAVGSRVPLADITPGEFTRVMTINAAFPLLAMQRAARIMPDGGRIINISTLNTALPVPGLALYSASKAALEQMSSIVARELGERGITVNTVSPGATDTDMFRDANAAEGVATITAMSALRRLGRPEDIADVVALLAGPDARWITGQNIRATGGLVL